MTPIPYKVKAYQSPHDGLFYGELFYGSNVVAQVKEGDISGYKSYGKLEGWARLAAAEHKWSVSPQDSHVIESSFTV